MLEQYLVRLEKAIVFSNDIRPVCLPEAPSDQADHLAGIAVSVSGWGKIENQASGPSEVLRTAHIQIYNQRYCSKPYIPFYTVVLDVIFFQKKYFLK